MERNDFYKLLETLQDKDGEYISYFKKPLDEGFRLYLCPLKECPGKKPCKKE